MRHASRRSTRQQVIRAISCGQQLLRWGSLLLCIGLLPGLWSPVLCAEQAEVEYAQGVLEYSNQNYVEALEHLRRAVALTPDNADTQFYLGLTFTRLGEYMKAIEALEKALQLDPSRQYVHYHLGLAYFNAQRYKDALAQFQLAEQYDPQKAATQFYLGQSFYLLRRYNQAPPFFQRALELDPTLTPRPQYYQGLAFYAAEQDAEAQSAFEAVVRSAPETAFGSQAQRYLEAIAQRARSQRLVQVEGTVGFEYDDNVILEPNAVEISGQADGRAVFNVVGRLVPIRTPSWRLGAEYALFQSLHFDLTEFNIQSHTAGVFAQYKLPQVTLHAAVNYNYSLLDDTRYAEAVTVQPSAIIKETESLYTVASVRYQQSNFFDHIPALQDPAVRDRDGWAVRAGAQQYWLFQQQQASVYLGYYYEANRSAGTDWEYDGHEISLGLQMPLWWNLTLNVAGAYTHQDYLHTNSFAAEPLGELTATDTRTRRDDRLVGAVLLSRPLGQFLTLTAGYIHTTNLSNLDFFDYHRNIWSLALTGRY